MNRAICSAVLLLLFVGAPTTWAALDRVKIDQLTGLKGTWIETEKVHRISQPRNDPPISVDGWAIPPFMGLTSWAAVTEGGKAEHHLL